MTQENISDANSRNIPIYLHRANSVCDRSRGIINNIYEGVIDGSLNTSCMPLKLVFFRKASLKYPYTCFHVLVVR